MKVERVGGGERVETWIGMYNEEKIKNIYLKNNKK